MTLETKNFASSHFPSVKLLELQSEEYEILRKKLLGEIKSLTDSYKEKTEKIKIQSLYSKEQQQEKIALEEINSLLEKKIFELCDIKQKLEETLQMKSHMIKELEQQKIVLSETSKELENKVENLSKSNKKLKSELDAQLIANNELDQEKILLSEISKDESHHNKIVKKKYLTLALIGIVSVSILLPYSLYMTTLVGEEFMIDDLEPLKSGHVIENLRGDKIDTHLSWKLVDGEVLRINVVNSKQYDPQILDSIKQTILSTEVIEVDNSLLHKGPKGSTSPMFVGWKGAMLDAKNQETKFTIPTDFEFIESNNGEGDIIIELTNKKSPDGFSGWTSTITDESQNQILKSRITIFDADSLSLQGLETIVRHEFGHALGLDHSTAPEDLMYPTIETNFPYVSTCNVDAITHLYDGGESSEVTCLI